MPRINGNGGVTGSINKPLFYATTGIWSLLDVEANKRSGQWPSAIGTVSVIVPCAGGNNVAAYPFTPGTGFGTRYAAPATIPAGSGRSSVFHPSGTDIIIGSQSNSPWIQAYPWSSNGFGTKYSDPTTTPGYDVTSLTMHTTGQAIVGTLTGGNNMIGYRYAVGVGIGNTYSNPATLPQGTGGYTAAFSPSGADVYVSSNASPYHQAYPFNVTSGFGTKYVTPSGGPTSTTTGVTFNTTGSDAIYGYIGGSSPYYGIFPFTSGSGFGTKITPTAANSAVWSLGFNPTGSHLAAGQNSTVRVDFFPYTNGSGTGTRFATVIPNTLSRTTFQVSWSPTGNDFFFAEGGTPNIEAWTWSNGIGTKYNNPGSLPEGNGQGVSVAAVAA
jgi:hypothetical protein